jgi:hypothetical protein
MTIHKLTIVTDFVPLPISVMNAGILAINGLNMAHSKLINKVFYKFTIENFFW